MKNSLKNIIKKAAWLGKFLGSHDHVLCFHKVIPHEADKSHHLSTYEYTISEFEEILKYYITQDYNFVDLNDIIQVSPPRTDIKRVCITFDDGYRDTLYLVLPILEKYRVPATVYVVPGYIDRSLPKWDYTVNYAVSDKRIINYISENLPEVADVFEASEHQDQLSVYELLKNHFKDCNNDQRFTVINSFTTTFSDYALKASKLMLNACEVCELAKSDLITIGSHSYSHFVMTDISDQTLAYEVCKSKQFLENLIQQNVDHFCFPYGAAAEREFASIQSSNYTTSATTAGRALMKYKRTNPSRIPRFVVRFDDTVSDIKNWQHNLVRQ